MDHHRFIQLAAEFNTLSRQFQATTDEVMRAVLDRRKFTQLAAEFNTLSKQFQATTDQEMRAIVLDEIQALLRKIDQVIGEDFCR